MKKLNKTLRNTDKTCGAIDILVLRELNHLISMHPFSNPSKISKIEVFWCFEGVKKGCTEKKKGLIWDVNRLSFLHARDNFNKQQLSECAKKKKCITITYAINQAIHNITQNVRYHTMNKSFRYHHLQFTKNLLKMK